jgi:hypothetical protein
MPMNFGTPEKQDSPTNSKPLIDEQPSEEPSHIKANTANVVEQNAISVENIIKLRERQRIAVDVREVARQPGQRRIFDNTNKLSPIRPTAHFSNCVC